MLTQDQLNNNKDKFFELLDSVKIEGIGELKKYLITSDFLFAPASTKYHNSYSGGLVEHSLSVYKHLTRLVDMYNMSNIISQNDIIICSLLHDLCKINTYKPSTKNVKNEETGQWEKVFCYKRECDLYMGHGCKSVYLIQKYIKLTDKQAQAIMFHMGFCDRGDYQSAAEISECFAQNKLAFLLHIADMNATYLD